MNLFVETAAKQQVERSRRQSLQDATRQGDYLHLQETLKLKNQMRDATVNSQVEQFEEYKREQTSPVKQRCRGRLTLPSFVNYTGAPFARPNPDWQQLAAGLAGAGLRGAAVGGGLGGDLSYRPHVLGREAASATTLPSTLPSSFTAPPPPPRPAFDGALGGAFDGVHHTQAWLRDSEAQAAAGDHAAARLDKAYHNLREPTLKRDDELTLTDMREATAALEQQSLINELETEYYSLPVFSSDEDSSPESSLSRMGAWSRGRREANIKCKILSVINKLQTNWTKLKASRAVKDGDVVDEKKEEALKKRVLRLKRKLTRLGIGEPGSRQSRRQSRGQSPAAKGNVKGRRKKDEKKPKSSSKSKKDSSNVQPDVLILKRHSGSKIDGPTVTSDERVTKNSKKRKSKALKDPSVNLKQYLDVIHEFKGVLNEVNKTRRNTPKQEENEDYKDGKIDKHVTGKTKGTRKQTIKSRKYESKFIPKKTEELEDYNEDENKRVEENLWKRTLETIEKKTHGKENITKKRETSHSDAAAMPLTSVKQISADDMKKASFENVESGGSSDEFEDNVHTQNKQKRKSTMRKLQGDRKKSQYTNSMNTEPPHGTQSESNSQHEPNDTNAYNFISDAMSVVSPRMSKKRAKSIKSLKKENAVDSFSDETDDESDYSNDDEERKGSQYKRKLTFASKRYDARTSRGFSTQGKTSEAKFDKENDNQLEQDESDLSDDDEERKVHKHKRRSTFVRTKNVIKSSRGFSIHGKTSEAKTAKESYNSQLKQDDSESALTAKSAVPYRKRINTMRSFKILDMQLTEANAKSTQVPFSKLHLRCLKKKRTGSFFKGDNLTESSDDGDETRYLVNPADITAARRRKSSRGGSIPVTSTRKYSDDLPDGTERKRRYLWNKFYASCKNSRDFDSASSSEEVSEDDESVDEILAALRPHLQRRGVLVPRVDSDIESDGEAAASKDHKSPRKSLKYKILYKPTDYVGSDWWKRSWLRDNYVPKHDLDELEKAHRKMILKTLQADKAKLELDKIKGGLSRQGLTERIRKNPSPLPPFDKGDTEHCPKSPSRKTDESQSQTPVVSFKTHLPEIKQPSIVTSASMLQKEKEEQIMLALALTQQAEVIGSKMTTSQKDKEEHRIKVALQLTTHQAEKTEPKAMTPFHPKKHQTNLRPPSKPIHKHKIKPHHPTEEDSDDYEKMIEVDGKRVHERLAPLHPKGFKPLTPRPDHVVARSRGNRKSSESTNHQAWRDAYNPGASKRHMDSKNEDKLVLTGESARIKRLMLRRGAQNVSATVLEKQEKTAPSASLYDDGVYVNFKLPPSGLNTRPEYRYTPVSATSQRQTERQTPGPLSSATSLDACKGPLLY